MTDSGLEDTVSIAVRGKKICLCHNTYMNCVAHLYIVYQALLPKAKFPKPGAGRSNLSTSERLRLGLAEVYSLRIS
jgi:hypothetical protein